MQFSSKLTLLSILSTFVALSEASGLYGGVYGGHGWGAAPYYGHGHNEGHHGSTETKEIGDMTTTMMTDGTTDMDMVVSTTTHMQPDSRKDRNPTGPITNTEVKVLELMVTPTLKAMTVGTEMGTMKDTTTSTLTATEVTTEMEDMEDGAATEVTARLGGE
uniref:Uncharacterized protein n=1 Tax=Ditylenchus dipsaci TaxID=166011 RepID=A0A915DJ22_9BILA